MTTTLSAPQQHSTVRRVAEQSWELALRSIRNKTRHPFNALPSIIFPLLLAAVYAAQFQKALGLPGFPEVDSFLDFILPAAVLQSISFGATEAGGDLALDIESGFFDRLIASPVSRVSILVGRLAGSAVEAAVKTLVLIGVFMAFGAEIKAGIPGVLAIMVTSVLLALAIGGLGLVIALRTGSQEAVNSTFPLVFVTIFISSAFFPTELMTGWYGAVARRNPVTWVIDPVRRLVISGWSWSDVGQAFGITAGLGVVTIAAAVVALRLRLAAS